MSITTSEITNRFSIYWFAALGAVVGSFLNVLIFRIPRGYSIHFPSRSICPHCKSKIEFYQNIPVISYLLLRGRCYKCHTKLSIRYPLVEILTIATFVALYKYFGQTFSFIVFYYCIFLSLLIAITFIDLDFRIIPDALSFLGMTIGLLGSFLTIGIESSLLGLLFGGGLFWLMSWLYHQWTGREGLGFGDVKLLAMIGSFVGPKGVLVTVILSSFVGSIIGITIAIIQKKNLKMAIPYGPFLAIGAMGYLFWGSHFMIW